MINIPCRKCGSINIRKNGTTAAGSQKYHCKACNFYGTPVTLAEKLLCGRVPQRRIARAVRISRNRLISHIKKRNHI